MADGTAPRNVSRNRNYHKDGSVIHSVWHNSALLDESGKLVSILSLVLDMTEETRLRQRLTHQVELLQRALMPSPPSLGDGYAAAAAYLPAFAGEEIGGDFYDSFETEDGKIGFVIGDVCGKGLGAASLAATSRNTVRAFAYDTLSAGESLSHTNTVLCAQEADPSRFVTVFVIILDPSNGTMNYASAGHPPAAIRRANGAVEFLGTDNLPVCILDKLDFESAQSSLSPGDKIVLYTDGILEARRGSEFFELEGVRRTLLEHGHKSPAELTNEMLQAAKDWSGGRLKDDVAILVVERTK
jgi:sigma-B regulation protein RsbU (phosphoserine phosphatase)